MFSDASEQFGCEAVVPNGVWFSLQWPSDWSSVDIVVKKLMPQVLAGVLRGHFGQDRIFPSTWTYSSDASGAAS